MKRQGPSQLKSKISMVVEWVKRTFAKNSKSSFHDNTRTVSAKITNFDGSGAGKHRFDIVFTVISQYHHTHTPGFTTKLRTLYAITVVFTMHCAGMDANTIVFTMIYACFGKSYMVLDSYPL